MQNGMWYMVVMTGVARFLCVYCKLGWFVRGLLSVFGAGSTIENAKIAFGSDMKAIVNEWAIQQVVSKLWALAGAFLSKPPTIVRWLSGWWFTFFVGAVLLNCMIVTAILYQRRGYFKRWGDMKKGGAWTDALAFGQPLTLQPAVDARNGFEKKADKDGSAKNGLSEVENLKKQLEAAEEKVSTLQKQLRCCLSCKTFAKGPNAQFCHKCGNKEFVSSLELDPEEPKESEANITPRSTKESETKNTI